MADDPQQPRDPAHGPGGPGRDEGPDQTQRFDPFHDRDAEPHSEPTEGARPTHDTGTSGVDETAPLPRRDDTVPLPPGDQTARLPRSDETAYRPGGDQTAPLPSTPGSWAGRAEVPPWGGAPVRDQAPADWGPGDNEGPRRWWLPILLGLVALLLLALLGFGIWLINQARDEGPGPVRPSPSPSPSAATTPAPVRPTSAAPTTAEPTPSATTIAPVQVPPVLGLPEEEARRLLDDAGLIYRLQYRGSEQTLGTVIATDPPEGAAVRPGTRVTLVIAVPPSAPTTPPRTATPRATATR
ncbi:PASTA domain-containing protein [Micromonospora sp. NPDC049679]|uniref:PASTA domain-containing protein n=1 Tax=Micromonospora sp. NPDC049679 TaxID=3155920 RepID=UPI00341070DB